MPLRTAVSRFGVFQPRFSTLTGASDFHSPCLLHHAKPVTRKPPLPLIIASVAASPVTVKASSGRPPPAPVNLRAARIRPAPSCYGIAEH